MKDISVDQLLTTTTGPGVYLMKNQKGTILYIGKAKNVRARLKQYFVSGGDKRAMIPFLISQVTTIGIVATLSEREAILLESQCIKRYQPKYNLLLKDDKAFVALTMNPKEEWPMIRLIRYRSHLPSPHLLFGPCTNGGAVRGLMEVINATFKLRHCSDRELYSRSRPCLLHAMKKCLAPCVDRSILSTYRQAVREAVICLRGRDDRMIHRFKQKIEEASGRLDFKRAEALLQMMQQLKQMARSHHLPFCDHKEATDVFAMQGTHPCYYVVKLLLREGELRSIEHFTFQHFSSDTEERWETLLLQHYASILPSFPSHILLPIDLKHQSLIENELSNQAEVHIRFPKNQEEQRWIQFAQKNVSLSMDYGSSSLLSKELCQLQETCHLTHIPGRIECYDISNCGGSDTVASMITFIEGKREKKGTRFFHIKNAATSDDYGALEEALTRRYRRVKGGGDRTPLPDLILIDGGKGHLRRASEILASLEVVTVDLIALSKEKGKHSKGCCDEKIYLFGRSSPLILPPHSQPLLTLQRMRDETHRVAVAFHRNIRSRRLFKSGFTEIPGIGPKKAEELRKELGHMHNIRALSLQKLQQVKKLTQKDREALVQFFQHRQDNCGKKKG